MRIAVIGGTAAGPAAAAEAIRQNPEAQVTLYEQDSHISVGSCEIPYYFGGMIDDWRKLEVLTPEKFEQSRGGTVRVRHRVREIQLREKKLIVEALDFGSIHEEPFDRIILATGARARKLNVEGENAPNVFPVRTLEDARAIHQWLEDHQPRHIVIAGGGFVGVEVSEMLRYRGFRVTVLDPHGRLLARNLSESMSAPFDEAVKASGVVVRPEVITGLRTDANGYVSSVETDKGERIGCDLVLVGVGLVPNVELGTSIGGRLGETSALIVDNTMSIGVPGVYACGDCIELPHVGSRAPIYLPLSPVARRTARVAARNAASSGRGARATLSPIVRIVGVKSFGYETAQVGLTEREARVSGYEIGTAQIRHRSRSSRAVGSKPVYIKLIVEKGTSRLLGGEFLGEEGAALRANVLVPLIRDGYTARQVSEDLDFVYNPPIAPAVDPIIIACSAAAKAALT